ncbi:hypothetical protein BDAG_04308 [Burkholderia dolosa AU0158]|nr:hypothetical protein BDAG_04308 [Burkholderia dolosa AU0158]
MTHSSSEAGSAHAQFVRVAERDRARIAFTLDGRPAQALAGDTVLTAILVAQRRVRVSEFGGEPRAGFCPDRRVAGLLGAHRGRRMRGARARRPSHYGLQILTGARPPADGDFV